MTTRSLAYLDTSPKRTCAHCGLQFTWVNEEEPWMICAYCQALWEILFMRECGYLPAPQYRPPRLLWDSRFMFGIAQAGSVG